MGEDEHLGFILILSSIDNWGAATAGPQFQWILHHDCRNQKCVWWRMVKNAPYWRKCMQWVFSGVGFLFYSHVLGTRFSQPSVCKSRPRKHCGHRAVLFNTVFLPTTWPTSPWYLWSWRENDEKQHGFNHHQLTMWLPGLVKAASLQHWRCLTPHPWNSEFQMQISLFCIMSQGSRKETAKDKEKKLQISWAKDIPNAFSLRPMVVCWSGGVVMLLGNTSWTASQAIRTDRMWESLATHQCLVFGWLEW